MIKKWLGVVKSVAASLMGIQSQQNYEEDFNTAQSVVPFVITGIVLVALFVFSLIMLVSFLIP